MKKSNHILFQMLAALLLSLCLNSAVGAEEPLQVYDKWGGDFSLTDHNGFPLSLSDFKGKVVLLNFGYTHCPDVCPSTMFTMKRVADALGAQSDKLQVLFITLDPERDHAERLRTYAEYFNPAFISLTGTVAEVSKVAAQYGTRFEKEGFDAEGNYSIAHTGVIYLIDQQGRISAFFKTIAPANQILIDVKRLLAEDASS